MNISIIGGGNVGTALAQQWIKAGHHVVIGARFPLSDKNRLHAAILGEDRYTSVEQAATQGDLILIATPPPAILDIIGQMGDVSGKILIDATNAVRQKPTPYDTVYHALVDNTRGHVVKCFNTTGFENMQNPVYHGQGLDMFMAGDHDGAKQAARQLALDAGFGACWDFGKGDKVVLLEQLALAWINLAILQGHGRDIAFRVLRR
ncbi:MAG: NAD(P)-binding domain-containing protein [Bacteroidia bacterium]|nr:NAD(P)-binding domain-containing protein [Bacteroidia bacterium]